MFVNHRSVCIIYECDRKLLYALHLYVMKSNCMYPCMCPFLFSIYGRNRSTLQNARNSCIEIMHEDDEPEEMNFKRLSSFSLANLLRE